MTGYYTQYTSYYTQPMMSVFMWVYWGGRGLGGVTEVSVGEGRIPMYHVPPLYSSPEHPQTGAVYSVKYELYMLVFTHI